MRQLLIGTASAAALMGTAAHGADVGYVTRSQAGWVQPGHAIARLADEGIGYSVLHDTPDVFRRGYRVHVTCTIDETFVQTYCPTPAYLASCPRARIACADGSEEVHALRLKY
ncbi:hypothetical protein GGR34_000245 [Microvirga flocculans]|uniref:Uncharacterized protein n=1 Tax=Microvirga flocculans TaxID=217168 RepID=A0A7W6IBW1_9HYPH|nr:hypothetical protein [Microvirga flocculans]MBB4038616.1 hypothetical protein [Microvirga flocculans]